jgi:hypothetical protein
MMDSEGKKKTKLDRFLLDDDEEFFDAYSES